MASNTKVFKYPVPDGFPAMSMPVVEARRFGDTEIVLAEAQPEDLLTIAELNCTAFPEVWWSKHEPLVTRPDTKTRLELCAKRFLPWLSHPAVRFIVAKVAATGEVVGGAGWHVPITEQKMPTHYPAMGDIKVPASFNPNAYRYDVVEAFGWREKMGWSQEEVDEMWASIDLNSWQDEFINQYDNLRIEELGDEPHWYLAPFFVKEQFRGRGVGSMLLDWAIQQADSHTPSTTMWLEALPNARPVYYHKGFRPIGREGSSALCRRGPAKDDPPQDE